MKSTDFPFGPYIEKLEKEFSVTSETSSSSLSPAKRVKWNSVPNKY